jgi:hypothetical protein
MNSYILYNENYRCLATEIQVQLHVSIIKSLGEEWLVLKDNAGVDDPRRPRGLRKLPERKKYHCIACSTMEKRERARTVCTHVTRGCMEDASLNAGTNCKWYVCTVLHNVM